MNVFIQVCYFSNIVSIVGDWIEGVECNDQVCQSQYGGYCNGDVEEVSKYIGCQNINNDDQCWQCGCFK